MISSLRLNGPGRLVGLVSLVLLFAGCSSTTQLDSIQSQLRDLQQQSLQIQKQTSSKQEIADLQEEQAARAEGLLRAQADIQVEMQSVAALIQQLEAKLEDTNYRLAQLSQQIAATNQELKASRSTPSLSPLATQTGTTLNIGVDPESQYQTAYNDYLRGRLRPRNFSASASTSRTSPIPISRTTLPIGSVSVTTANGSSKRRFGEFDQVFDRYPTSDKLASTLLRKGYAFLELGDQAQGVVQLQQVSRRYPQSDEANLARQQLRSLGIDPPTNRK